MKNLKTMFSSATPEWATPQDFFDELNNEFHFTVDVCATKENAKCKRFYDRERNGLAQSWKNDICWMNPPYGREISKWVKKASEGGGRSSCLSFASQNRYSLVPRLYIQQNRNTLYKRSTQIWWMQKFSAISIYGGNL